MNSTNQYGRPADLFAGFLTHGAKHQTRMHFPSSGALTCIITSGQGLQNRAVRVSANDSSLLCVGLLQNLKYLVE